jgi:hypothetical protein
MSDKATPAQAASSKIEKAFAQQETLELRSDPLKTSEAAALLPPGILAFRQNWGFKHGQWELKLTSPLFNRRSIVVASIGEGFDVKFVGAARCTMHNVAPGDGVISVWVDIQWGSPIAVSVDYVVIDPLAE